MSSVHSLKSSDKLLGHGAMLFFAFLVSISFFSGNRAALYIEPAVLNLIRFTIAGLIMGTIAFSNNHFQDKDNRLEKIEKPDHDNFKLSLPEAPWRFLILGGLIAFYMITMFYALGVSNSVSVGAVFTLMPLLTTIIGFIMLKQVTSLIGLVSLMCAFFGAIWVIFDGDFDAIKRFEVGTGEIVFFFGVVAHAFFSPLLKKFNRNEPGTVFTFWIIAGGVLWLLLASLPSLVSTNWFSMPLIVWVTIIYLAVFATCGTFFLMQFAMQRIPVGKANAYIYLTPGYIIIMEGLAGTGWASMSVIAGAGLIVAGLIVLILSPEGTRI